MESKIIVDQNWFENWLKNDSKNDAKLNWSGFENHCGSKLIRKLIQIWLEKWCKIELKWSRKSLWIRIDSKVDSNVTRKWCKIELEVQMESDQSILSIIKDHEIVGGRKNLFTFQITMHDQLGQSWYLPWWGCFNNYQEIEGKVHI